MSTGGEGWWPGQLKRDPEGNSGMLRAVGLQGKASGFSRISVQTTSEGVSLTSQALLPTLQWVLCTSAALGVPPVALL